MHSRVFFIFLLFFVFGVALHSIFLFSWGWTIVLAALAGLIFITIAFSGHQFFWLALPALFGLIFGLWRTEIAWRATNAVFGESPILLQVKSEPKVKELSTQFLAETGHGRLWVIVPSVAIIHYGDQIRGECSPKPVILTEPYSGYYLSKQAGTICFLKSVRVIKPGDSFLENLWSLKNRLVNSIQNIFRVSEANLLSGMLFGTSTLSSEMSNNFRRAGLTHLVAISGYNFSLLAFFMVAFLELWYLPRRAIMIVALILLFGFFILVGPGASTLRALIMATLTLVAKVFGRRRNIFHLYILALAAMLMINPLSLRFDAGFNLSFAATAVLIFAVPAVSMRLYAWLNLEKIQGRLLFFKYKDLIETVSEIILASIMIMIAASPILWYFFGTYNFTSVLANVAVAPIVPFVMMGGYLFSITALFISSFAAAIAWVVTPFLRYIAAVARFF